MQQAVDSSFQSIQNYLKQNTLVLRTAMKIEKIRDEGLKGTDVVKIGCVVGTCCAAKKLFDFFHLKELLQGDASLTKEALAQCKKEYKKILLGAGAASLVGYLVWRSHQETHVFDKLQLSPEQRAQCSRSIELSALVRDNDYSSLLEHEALIPLLNDKQHILRQSLIEEYGKDCSLHLLDEMDA